MLNYYKNNPEKLINTKGRLVGVSFARRKSTTHAIKIEINGKTTMLGLSPTMDFDEQYEKAVNKVLEFLEIDVSDDLKKLLLKTKYQFLKDFNIGFKRITIIDFGD
jgi:hypothetical protein